MAFSPPVSLLLAGRERLAGKTEGPHPLLVLWLQYRRGGSVFLRRDSPVILREWWYVRGELFGYRADCYVMKMKSFMSRCTATGVPSGERGLRQTRAGRVLGNSEPRQLSLRP